MVSCLTSEYFGISFGVRELQNPSSPCLWLLVFMLDPPVADCECACRKTEHCFSLTPQSPAHGSQKMSIKCEGPGIYLLL